MLTLGSSNLVTRVRCIQALRVLEGERTQLKHVFTANLRMIKANNMSVPGEIWSQTKCMGFGDFSVTWLCFAEN